MTTTDTDALLERLRAEIIRSECGDNPVPIFVRERADRLAATVLPIVRQAQAEAWEKGGDDHDQYHRDRGQWEQMFLDVEPTPPINPYEQEAP